MDELQIKPCDSSQFYYWRKSKHWCLTLQRSGIKGINKRMNFYIPDSGLYEMDSLLTIQFIVFCNK
jgi:hypothetical protein